MGKRGLGRERANILEGVRRVVDAGKEIDSEPGQ